MKLDKRSFCRGFAEEYGYRKSDIYAIYDDLVKYIHDQLAIGNAITFKSSFTVYPKPCKSKMFRMPTGEFIEVPLHMNPACKFSAVLRQKLRDLEVIDGISLDEYAKLHEADIDGDD